MILYVLLLPIYLSEYSVYQSNLDKGLIPTIIKKDQQIIGFLSAVIQFFFFHLKTNFKVYVGNIP